MDFLVDFKSEIRISAYLSQHRPYYGIVTAQQLGMTVWSKPNFSSVGYRIYPCIMRTFFLRK